MQDSGEVKIIGLQLYRPGLSPLFSIPYLFISCVTLGKFLTSLYLSFLTLKKTWS